MLLTEHDHPALLSHCVRVELENHQEHFASVPDGSFAFLYAKEKLHYALEEKGWARIWAIKVDDAIVAHASLYDLMQPDGIVFGHISVEKGYRGLKLPNVLNAERFKFLDDHNLTLLGAVAPGNNKSMQGCLANGFEVVMFDEETKETWVARYPK